MEGSKGGLHLVLRDDKGKIKEEYRSLRTETKVLKQTKTKGNWKTITKKE